MKEHNKNGVASIAPHSTRHPREGGGPAYSKRHGDGLHNPISLAQNLDDLLIVANVVK